MIDNAAIMGERLKSGLAAIPSNLVREVRGRGLMLAVELHPDAGGARPYVTRLQSLGILCKDTHEHTIRIAPPLVITGDEVDWAVDRFAQALHSA
jgi:ornithine--oxo-acid transaminase